MIEIGFHGRGGQRVVTSSVVILDPSLIDTSSPVSGLKKVESYWNGC